MEYMWIIMLVCKCVYRQKETEEKGGCRSRERERKRKKKREGVNALW